MVAVSEEDASPSAAGTAFRPLQAILTLGGIQGLTMAAGLARTKVLAVVLGPGGLGIVGVIDQTVGLVTHLGSLSLPFAAVTFLSRQRGGDPERTARLYAAFFKALLAASLLATAIAVGVAIWRTEWLSAELDPFRPALVLGLAGAPALAAVGFLRSVLAAVERHYQAGLFALLGGVALIATSYLGVVAGGLPGLYLGNLAVAGLTVVGVVRYLQVSDGLGRSQLRRSVWSTLSEEPGIGGFLATIHLLSLFSPAAYLLARVTLLNHHGAGAAGIYYAAYGLAVAMRVVLSQANTLYLTPILNQAHRPEVKLAAVAEYIRVLVVILLLGALPVVLFPGEWVTLLYSPQFLAAAAAVGAFVLSEAILAIAGVYQMLLIGLDDVAAHAFSAVAGQVTLALLSLLWAPSHSVMGIAMAFIVGHSLILALLLLRLRSTHRASSLLRSLQLVVLAVVGLAGATFWSLRMQPPGVAKLFALLLTSALLIALLRPDERRWLFRPFKIPRR